MHFNKINSFRQIAVTIILAILIIGCETSPLSLPYSWETYEQDKIKLRTLPEITKEDLFYLDKYVKAYTLMPEYAMIGGAIHLLKGINYKTLIDQSKIYIKEQRKKLETAPDSIQIKYLGLKSVGIGSLHYNLYEVTNLYHKRLCHMEGIWQFYHMGSYFKEFKDAYIVNLDPQEKGLIQSENFPLNWIYLDNSIGSKNPDNITIKFIPRILKFADGTHENFILEPR